ncbi:MAG: putative Ig domain-containing protein, partial [Oscillospiraceae bacterium]|nr:putative Ig domain-containing protein [Oscillospiraceae bacterium]
ATDALIENNIIEHILGAGVMVGFDTSPDFFDLAVNPEWYENIRGVVRNNLIMDIGWEGIGLYGSKDAQIYNNTLVNVNNGSFHSAIYFGLTYQDWDPGAGRPASVNPSIHHNIVCQPSAFNRQMLEIRYSGDLGGMPALSGRPAMHDNCYYIDGKNAAFTDNRPGSPLSNAGLAAWQAHIGGDSGSLGVNPALGADYMPTNPQCAGMGLLYPLIFGSGAVSVAPAITSAAGTTVVSGTGGTFQVTATGTAPITYSLTGTVPAGVSINSASGLITIAPAVTAGPYSFTVNAANGTAPNAAQAFTLTVSAAPVTPVAPTITSGNSYACTAGTGGSFALTATGTTPISWSLSGSVPAGVTVSGGMLNVASTVAAGTYSFTVHAANGTAPNAAQAFTLTVNAGGGAATPAKGIFGTNARYQAWWCYLLFFFCFGFLWMWF